MPDLTITTLQFAIDCSKKNVFTFNDKQTVSLHAYSCIWLVNCAMVNCQNKNFNLHSLTTVQCIIIFRQHLLDENCILFPERVFPSQRCHTEGLSQQ